MVFISRLESALESLWTKHLTRQPLFRSCRVRFPPTCPEPPVTNAVFICASILNYNLLC